LAKLHISRDGPERRLGRSYLARAERHNPTLNAIIVWPIDQARGTNFSKSITFELSTSSAFSSSAVKVLEPLADHHVRAKRIVGIRLSPTEPTAPIKRRSSCRAATEATDFEAGR
jgi:hypothetical protein